MGIFYLLRVDLALKKSQKSCKAHGGKHGRNIVSRLHEFFIKEWCGKNIMRLSFSLTTHTVALEQLSKLDCETHFECHNINSSPGTDSPANTLDGTTLIWMFKLQYIPFVF